VAVDLKSQEDIYTQLVTLSDQYFLLLEKPLALTYQRAVDLLSISAQPENIFVAVNRRFYPEIELIRAALANQNGLRHVAVTDQESYWSHSRNTNIFEMRRTAIMSNSIHLVDLVTMLCRGSLDEITPMWNLSNQTNCLLIRSREGDICSYTFHWDIPGPWSLAISTKSIYAELNPLETVRFRTTGTRKWLYGDTPPTVNDLKRGLLEQTSAFLAVPSARDFRLQTIKAHLPSVKLAEDLARLC
jgi:predicted dehydrogenase